MRNRPTCFFTVSLFCSVTAVFLVSICVCLGVTSKVTRHNSSADLSAGKTKDVVVGSKGTLELGRASEVLVDKFEDVWSINSIVVNGGTIFVGTSPNGGLYEYSLGKLTKIYPLKPQEKEKTEKRGKNPADANEPNDVNEPGDPNVVKAEQHLSNEHIFAMATDVSGRLLAGISGRKCALCRLEMGKLETVFEPNDANDAKYVFAIALDKSGNIYLGTGPKGKVYMLDSFGKQPQVIYTSTDKNILSLAVKQDGFIYAGSDSRGLVYKIDPRTKTAAVLYDSEQEEITSLLFLKDSAGGAENLYAAATLAQITAAGAELAPQISLPGRPEPAPEKKGEKTGHGGGGLQLKVANTKKDSEEKPPPVRPQPGKEAKPEKASYIYKITPEGFVTDIFSETAVFFCLAEQQGRLLVGTGNHGRLFSVDITSEQNAVIYENTDVSQITAVVVAGNDVYVGTANPAKLIKLGSTYAAEGTFTSALVDAGQPAQWGKLQIEADIPQGSTVLAACRSGNVKDVNDPTFSPWTEPIEVKEPIQLQCPLGRFCQYKLVLRSSKDGKNPLIREIAVADTVPNLAPTVEEVSAARIEAADKSGVLKISYKAKDENNDKLIYQVDFRKLGWTNWIKIKDKIEADSFEWDAKTVEDGRYEIKVTASDERSNTAATKLTASRISDPVVVDNTGPAIKNYSVETADKTVTLKLKAVDELSAIGRLQYTVDSNADWTGTLPDDSVYDTTEENFTIVIKDLKAGEHIIAVKVADDVNNTTYKTFNVNIGGN
jgi:hypothetical protein